MLYNRPIYTVAPEKAGAGGGGGDWQIGRGGGGGRQGGAEEAKGGVSQKGRVSVPIGSSGCTQWYREVLASCRLLLWPVHPERPCYPLPKWARRKCFGHTTCTNAPPAHQHSTTKSTIQLAPTSSSLTWPLVWCGPSQSKTSTSVEVPSASGRIQMTTQHLSHRCRQIAAPCASRVKCSPYELEINCLRLLSQTTGGK